uniref:GRIP domain-containing protein n=1 Tax=Loa loa TaxID=7209 RepID=A0A1I7VXL6_LOALO
MWAYQANSCGFGLSEKSLRIQRQQWENQKRVLEAKQPMDVQMLQGQKRELTMQLDREQAEKQELFLQINSLIAQLADANRDNTDHQECNLLKDENEKLKKQITDILAIQSQLNTDVHNLQEEVRCKNQEVENAQDESKRLRLIMNNEKIQLENSIEELQRDLQMKSAALQSLMLAKQDIKTNEADSAMIIRLTVENEELRGQIEEIRNEVKGRVSDIEEVKLENEKKLKNLQIELDSMRENAKEKEAELFKQSDEIGKLQSELNSALENMQKGEAELSFMRNNEVHEVSQLREALEKYKLDAGKISERLEESQRNLAECEEKCDALKKDAEAKLMRESNSLADVRKKYDEEIRQQETKFNNLKQSLKVEEMRTQEAEQEAKSCRLKITDLEEELKVLRIQTDKQRGVDEQMRLLREELKQAKHKITVQAADLEKAETDADEAERSSRETIDELEEEVRSLQEKLKILEIDEKKQSKRLLMVEQEMMKSQETSEKYERKCEMLMKELEEVRAAFIDTNAILETFKAENEKLLAKASLEDEVLTLATSLQSARDEISIKHDEIAKLRKELREVHEENERLLMDVDVQTQTLQQDAQSARSEGDEARKEMEKCKSDKSVQQQENGLILVELRNEISKLEEQVIEKERMLGDLESKYQKMLINAKQQHEQQITELNKEVERLKASESGKIDEEKWKLECKKSEADAQGAKIELEKLTKTNETFIGNIKRLTDELEVERKRIIDLGIEKVHLLSEIEQLKNELDTLKTRNTLKEDSPKMKRKLSELMAENARLTSELLKEHNPLDEELSKQNQQMEGLLKKHDERWEYEEKLLPQENREELRKLTEDYERRLQRCNEEWTIKSNNQEEILKREMKRVKDENEELRSQNERIRKEMGEIQREMEGSKQISEEPDIEKRLNESEGNLSRLKAVCNIPTPPPRKRIGSEITDGVLQLSLAEENKKLKKDIEIISKDLLSAEQQLRPSSGNPRDPHVVTEQYIMATFRSESAGRLL